ncbi:hypothetical protein DEU56DRAFT_920027 [Suillus clintonianus]|uniref:uncharacterized protein n=1 Tax=Suillus clintonianus TaxID=1904413 RepID=UPI001B878E92|nr:uncharacterized protein DEU56DRAFT_920027 [Suillus clintonianus]KAG2111457.1 hypothetical protein DEU56DRAFT_920027 [Suillus clintonianus]
MAKAGQKPDPRQHYYDRHLTNLKKFHDRTKDHGILNSILTELNNNGRLHAKAGSFPPLVRVWRGNLIDTKRTKTNSSHATTKIQTQPNLNSPHTLTSGWKKTIVNIVSHHV